MADDALSQDLIDVDFVGGEQPDSSKLTGMMRQLKGAVETIDKAIGDLYHQQQFLSSGGAYQLASLPSVGPNLTRLVGSAAWMNPRHLGRLRTSASVIFSL